MTDFTSAEDVRDAVVAVVNRAVMAGLPNPQTFDGVAQAFGMMLAVSPPRETGAWLRREAGRIEALAASPSTETEQ